MCSLPNTTLVVDQVVAYYRKAAQEQPTKTVNSLICMERNSQGKVIRLQEEWDHKGEKDSSDGFLGMLSVRFSSCLLWSQLTSG